MALTEMSIPRKEETIKLFVLIIIKFGLVIKVTLVQVSSVLIVHVFFMDFLTGIFLFFPEILSRRFSNAEKLKEFLVSISKAMF